MRLYNRITNEEYYPELGGMLLDKFVKALKDENNFVENIKTDTSKKQI